MFSFAKYHGIGNDFIIWSPTRESAPLAAEEVRYLCAPHVGVGADGVLTVWLRENFPDVRLLPLAAPAALRAGWRSGKEGQKVFAYMQVQNADGSPSAMCGNGLRCVVRYLHEQRDYAEAEIFLQAGERVYRCTRLDLDNYALQMGEALSFHPELPAAAHRLPDGGVKLTVGEKSFIGIPVHLGNPHVVIFCPPGTSLTALQDLVARYGAALAQQPLFSAGVNVSFAALGEKPRLSASDGRLEGPTVVAAVYERGVGPTAACGTAACAVGVAAIWQGLAPAERPLAIQLPGGKLTIKLVEQELFLEGEAKQVFTGEIAHFQFLDKAK